MKVGQSFPQSFLFSNFIWFQSSEKTLTSTTSSLSQTANVESTPISTNSSPIINLFDHNSSLISINNTTQISINLASSNYTSWCFEFHTILIGYDLMGFIDGMDLSLSLFN